MKLLLDEKNTIMCINENIITSDLYDGRYYVKSEDAVYPIESKLVEVETIPLNVKCVKYKYENGNFVINSDFVEPIDIEETVRQQQLIIDQLLIDSLMGV